jgi:hypothetical protein
MAASPAPADSWVADEALVCRYRAEGPHGTAKGGIVLAICDELKIPVRYIGLGERAEDLKEFDAESFVEALFGDKADEARAA